ncbi:unnamed protein product [Miscanthus lutarioriparius]|uniref:At2g23090-like zinc-binding domain-containing protein n=1 Tax=Miscanthus lutarioriparius TaxID=422564 RepID=A0A811ND52_9POAL|nr:unnamed protein product [Miscanthus lutarioriparius]
MGGGNGQKSKMARERNAEKNKGAKGTCIHPSLQSPRPDSPSLPVLPCSPSRLIPSISSPYLLAGSQLEANKKAMNIQCKICMQTFICTTSEAKCKEHAEARHPKNDLYQCFPHLKN